MKKSIFLFFAAILCAVSMQAKVVYFKNTANWTNVNCYYWDGVTAPDWPGNTMTRIGSTSYYYLDIGNAKKCIFSNNGSNQTADLDAQDGQVYHYGDKNWYSNFSVDNFTIYFDARNATDWNNPHLRIGRSNYSSAYPLTIVAGTKYLYSVKAPSWENYEAYTITNSAGYTGGNTIYQPSDKKPENEWAITKLINYQNGDILENKYITASQLEQNEDDADYWKVTVSNTLPSYKVSYSQTGVGTLAVKKYTGSKYEALASGTSVHPTQIIKIETNADCKLTVTGATQIDGGNTYYVTAATTIKAEFASVAKFAGELTDWANNAKSFTTNEDIATLYLELTQGEHKFKIIETVGDEMFWHGNLGTMSRKNCEEWIFDQDADATIIADVAGTYKLTWDFVTNELSITYPTFPAFLSSQPDIIYFQPSEAWKTGNARYAAYFCHGDKTTEDKWADLEDEDGDGVYEVANEKKHSVIIFVRMNPASTENRWNTDAENNSADKPVWNQTGNLFIPMDGKNCFKMTPKNNNQWDISGEWSLYVPTIQLVDGDNSATLTKYNGKTVHAQVKRTFVADGGYYTICLPFDLKASKIGIAYQVTDITEHVAEKGFNMVFSVVSELKAGQPYLILPNNLTDPIFKDVTISYNDKNKGETVVHAEGAGINFDMIGKINGAGKTNGLYWVGTSGYFYNDNTDILGLRTYFSITDNNGTPLNIRARVVVNENAATGVDNITNTDNTTIKVIENGQLIIIRNGEKFNAQGVRL